MEIINVEKEKCIKNEYGVVKNDIG